jgi:Arc/MetJ-type ribon-helix-helix transcriptional regulator
MSKMEKTEFECETVNVTVAMPKDFVDAITEYLPKGRYESLDDFIREAVRAHWEKKTRMRKLQVPAETYRRLEAVATASGVTVEEYLEKLVGAIPDLIRSHKDF